MSTVFLPTRDRAVSTAMRFLCFSKVFGRVGVAGKGASGTLYHTRRLFLQRELSQFFGECLLLRRLFGLCQCLTYRTYRFDNGYQIRGITFQGVGQNFQVFLNTEYFQITPPGSFFQQRKCHIPFVQCVHDSQAFLSKGCMQDPNLEHRFNFIIECQE